MNGNNSLNKVGEIGFLLTDCRVNLQLLFTGQGIGHRASVSLGVISSGALSFLSFYVFIFCLSLLVLRNSQSRYDDGRKKKSGNEAGRQSGLKESAQWKVRIWDTLRAECVKRLTVQIDRVLRGGEREHQQGCMQRKKEREGKRGARCHFCFESVVRHGMENEGCLFFWSCIVSMSCLLALCLCLCLR